MVRVAAREAHIRSVMWCTVHRAIKAVVGSTRLSMCYGFAGQRSASFQPGPLGPGRWMQVVYGGPKVRFINAAYVPRSTPVAGADKPGRWPFPMYRFSATQPLRAGLK